MHNKAGYSQYDLSLGLYTVKIQNHTNVLYCSIFCKPKVASRSALKDLHIIAKIGEMTKQFYCMCTI